MSNSLIANIFSGFEKREPLQPILEAKRACTKDMENSLKREAAYALLRDLETIATADWERDKLVTLQGGLLVRSYIALDGKYREIRINIENCVSSIPRHDFTIPVEQTPSNIEIELHLVRMCLGALEAVL